MSAGSSASGFSPTSRDGSFAEAPPSPREGRRLGVHFPGLNGLRFLAALFVVLGHIPLNQQSRGLPYFDSGALFFRGAPAVYFFFALSGFLITYLLLEEIDRHGKIDVERFYLRRVLRIWPVYFVVIGFGLAFYNFILPALGIEYPVHYRLSTAVALYLFFLPNLMNNLYTVGGILNPTWSIGVEEQYYLLWAPLVRWFPRRIPILCAVLFAFSFLLFLALGLNGFEAGWAIGFVGQLKFHFMAAGGLTAWALKRNPAQLARFAALRARGVRLLLWGLLLEFYFLGQSPWGWLGTELLQLSLYCWLILEVGARTRPMLSLENPVLDYLGRISYGIYMYHMIAVYSASAFFERVGADSMPFAVYWAAYHVIAVGGTISLAAISYRVLERPFLRLKNSSGGSISRTSLPGSAPAGDPAIPLSSTR